MYFSQLAITLTHNILANYSHNYYIASVMVCTTKMTEFYMY